jgi:hypothetical protein
VICQDSLEVRRVPGKGRGVFTCEAIDGGTLVHVAHVIEVPGDDVGKVLDAYVYKFGATMAVALGLGSLFNHSRSPNLDFSRDFDGRVIRYWATREIRPLEELTIEYSYDPPGYVETPTGEPR